jgi:serine/threonine protein kinase
MSIDPADDATVPPSARRRSGNALPAGARLVDFEIKSVVGEGGFGIVYLAWDRVLHRQVAIKEYMPASLASRTQDHIVAPHSDKVADTFALGLRSFINEAQLLASFDHPSLVKVYRFWEGNGTAYMVMPYYQGVTLKRTLEALPAPPDEAWLKSQLGALLDALQVMHAGHCYHRDIAPDNILLLDDGRPLLLDFGAARRVIGDATQALTAFLKPGYAPVEQYAEMPSMKQGPWTDLYALGSVAHAAITGHTPPESVARLVNDTMVPLEQAAAGRYGARFLRALDHALAVRPQDRPQSVAVLRDELGIEAPRTRAPRPREIPTAPAPLDAAAVAPEPTIQPLRPSAASVARGAVREPAIPAPPRRSPWRAIGWVGAVLLPLVATFAFGLWWFDAPSSPRAAPPPAGAAAPAAPLASPGAPPAVRSVSGATEPGASEPDDGGLPPQADTAVTRDTQPPARAPTATAPAVVPPKTGRPR